MKAKLLKLSRSRTIKFEDKGTSESAIPMSDVEPPSGEVINEEEE
jgi:hypothetical protein